MVLVAFALQPFTTFLNDNRAELAQPGRVAFYGTVNAAVAIALYGGSLMAIRRARPDRLALGVSAFVFSFWNFSSWLSAYPFEDVVRFQLVIWTLVTALGVVLVYRFARSRSVRLFLGVLGVLMAALPLGNYLLYAATRGDDAERSSGTDDIEPLEPGTDLPNVYWFMFDEYARGDQLASLLDFNNQPYFDELEARDFQIVETAMTSYPATWLSLSTTLEMDYVTTSEDIEGGIPALGPRVRGDNATVERFRAFGYQYVYSPGGVFNWARCTTELADICIPTIPGNIPGGELEVALLRLNPIGSLGLIESPHTNPTYVLDEVLGHEELRAPYFVFSHVMTPHAPYRYGEGCAPRDHPLEAPGLSWEDKRAAYLNDITCVNDLTIEAIDRILAGDPTAVIILQSDHGSNFLLTPKLPFEEWSDDALHDRFVAFDAIRLPEGCEYPSLDPSPLVNTFRVVFGCIEGTEPEMLEYRAFSWRQAESERLGELDVDRVDGEP